MKRQATPLPATYRFVSTARDSARARTGVLSIDGRYPRLLEILKHEMTCTQFCDSVWGFVVNALHFVKELMHFSIDECLLQIYRCVEGNDAARNFLLQAIQEGIQTQFDPQYHPGPVPDNILEFHDLHVIDDKEL